MNIVLTTRRRLIAGALILIGICLTLVSCGDAKGPKRLLQLKLNPKDAFILYISGENELLLGDITANFGGQFETMYRWDVLSVDPEGNIEFNVSVKSADYPMLMSPLGRAFQNSTFKVRMAADGEILSFDGTEEMRAEVSTKLIFPFIEQRKKEGLSGEDYEKAIHTSKQSMLIQIQDESLRGLFEPLFRVWPAIPVAQGDRWTLEQIPTFLPTHIEGVFATTEFEVTSWEEGEVTLDMQGILQTVGTDEAKKFSGSTHGTIILDAIGGFLKSASITREAEGNITPPFGEQQRELAVTLHEEVVVKILRL